MEAKVGEGEETTLVEVADSLELTFDPVIESGCECEAHPSPGNKCKLIRGPNYGWLCGCDSRYRYEKIGTFYEPVF